MPSPSLQKWQTTRAASLDEIEAAHASIGGVERGRRYATQQINQAYVVILSSQFQGFCRDLHSECVDYLLQGISPSPVQNVLGLMAITGRKLDTGNPNPGNIGADFGGFLFKIWERAYMHDKRNRERRKHLELLNEWRNAIAHQDFSGVDPTGKTGVQLVQIRRWRGACSGLSASFDTIMRKRLFEITGSYPW